MGMTMTQKILAAHAGLDHVEAGQLIEAQLDLVLGNDITSPVAIHEMDKMTVDTVFDKLAGEVISFQEQRSLQVYKKRPAFICISDMPGSSESLLVSHFMPLLIRCMLIFLKNTFSHNKIIINHSWLYL